MIFLPLKRYAVAILLLTSGLSQASNSQANNVAQPQQGVHNNTRLQMILGVNAQASMDSLTNAASQLQMLYQQHPDYRMAKMFSGYAQLFMAKDFLLKKNYMRAAESSKLGFFYIDEAAETDENDWQMRYLRARMDAFVPASNGRCVVALQDLNFLQQNPAVPADLKPMILLMSANALTDCQRESDAKAALASLAQLGEEGKRLATLKGRAAPAWTPAELKNILQPLAEIPL
ncbi:hypothetical protein [Serratia sp. DD3]|uniref:hypothetical protein n=1 Tax=Serratia sp. DD3 TaxID=1410619 RepID=UPI0003C51614|nr:hypothetical protein [Serratia sp. DD3]KEY57374.1 hypothetical protein SRDD_37440 [Serratia sp. DD3]